VGCSLLGLFLLVPPQLGVEVLVAGTVIYLVVASPFSYRLRVGTVAAVFVVATIFHSQPAMVSQVLKQHDLKVFFPLFGALFMFRIIVYLHDIRFMTGRPPLIEYLAYFFILPNFIFLLFPVVDYKTMRLSYFRKDIHVVAQRGIQWIWRGVLQLLAYRVVFHWQEMLSGRRSLGAVAAMMFLTFLLYLLVSGTFHIAIGILRLFGYDLPETNHKYLLSRSMTDFWRRINIYWKDFMVKLVYFPVYFRLRKKNELQAQLSATCMVFMSTWALHSYQAFWLTGHFVVSWPDTLFWLSLGVLMMLNVWWEVRFPHRRAEKTLWHKFQQGAAVACTLSIIVVLWSLWSSPSITAWIQLLTWWKDNP